MSDLWVVSADYGEGLDPVMAYRDRVRAEVSAGELRREGDAVRVTLARVWVKDLGGHPQHVYQQQLPQHLAAHIDLLDEGDLLWGNTPLELARMLKTVSAALTAALAMTHHPLTRGAGLE